MFLFCSGRWLVWLPFKSGFFQGRSSAYSARGKSSENSTQPYDFSPSGIAFFRSIAVICDAKIKKTFIGIFLLINFSYGTTSVCIDSNLDVFHLYRIATWIETTLYRNDSKPLTVSFISFWFCWAVYRGHRVCEVDFRIPGHFIYMCRCAFKTDEVYNNSCYSYSMRCW